MVFDTIFDTASMIFDTALSHNKPLVWVQNGKRAQRILSVAGVCVKLSKDHHAAIYEDEILNYFDKRETNASAESLNSKMKCFRSSMRDVRDIPFFFYRSMMVFG